jgi:pyrimidine deaminase RibD-like protein
MRSRRLGVMTLLLAIALVGPTLIATYAQHKGDRVAGTVQLINKETKTIVVSSEANNKQTQVTYDDKTKVTKDNKDASIDDVQNGLRIICTGSTNDKGQLHAERIDVRPAS